MTPNEQIDLGRESALLTENPAFIRAIQRLREAYQKHLMSCPLTDKEGLTLIAQRMHVLADFEKTLRSLIEAGEMAKIEMDKKLRRDSSAERLLRRIV